MENQSERFKELIKQAQALLNMSPQELTDKYSELIRQIEKGTPKKVIEIRLNKEKVTISCIINEQKQCTDIYIFFDRTEDEDAFISYLVDYSFKRRLWLLKDCNIITEKIKNIFAFHFCK